MIKERVVNFEDVINKANDYDRKAKKSWAIEIIVCVGIILIVAAKWLFMSPPLEQIHPLLHAGYVAIIAGSGFVAWKIIISRKINEVDDWTLAAKLDIQIEKQKKDLKLIQGIAYWYLSPLFVATIMYSYGGYVQRSGSYIPSAGYWVFWLGLIAVYVAIYKRNQRAAKTKIQPVLDQLYALKNELEK